MKTNIYVLRDEISNEQLLFTAKNEQVLNRMLKQAMSSKQPSPFNTDIEDKRVYQVGEFDQENTKISPCEKQFIISLGEVREQLLIDIRREKQRLESVGIKDVGTDNNGIDNSSKTSEDSKLS